jgi:pyruvate formate lyase activating enzyme
MGPERGYLNLSVFFYGCNFDCLYCQNSSHKQLEEGRYITAEDLAQQVKLKEEITCICYFGGSPEPQLPFSIKVSKLAKEYAYDRVMRLCWEWNGCGDPKLVNNVAKLALDSGGNMKFDLKCYTPSLSVALSGVDNSRAYSNFEMVARKYYPQRPDVPVLTATTLMVPGYVDVKEIEHIAGFIAKLDESIPYSLLVFHPDYAMRDLPYTSLKQAQESYITASGLLDNVNVGNLHTFGMRNMSEFKKSLPT